MTIIRRERRGSFKAVAADGSEHVINVTVEIVAVVTRGNPNGEADGMTILTTDRGEHVNQTGKGQYTILGNGRPDIDVTTTDPNAQ